MKKRKIAFLSFLFFVFGQLYSQNTSSIDLILLLDTSSEMAPSYETVNDYITGAFLSEFLRIGDTFHLIEYSSSPRLDIARRINGIGDIETIIGRMLLQYPLERGNDARGAISFVENYVSSLPERPKKIVVVGRSSSDTQTLVSGAAQRLASFDATIDFVPVTHGQALSNLPSSGRPALPRTRQQTPAPRETAVAAAAEQTQQPQAQEPAPAQQAQRQPAVTESAPAQQAQRQPAVTESAPAQQAQRQPAVAETVPAQQAQRQPAVTETVPVQEPPPLEHEPASTEIISQIADEEQSDDLTDEPVIAEEELAELTEEIAEETPIIEPVIIAQTAPAAQRQERSFTDNIFITSILLPLLLIVLISVALLFVIIYLFRRRGGGRSSYSSAKQTKNKTVNQKINLANTASVQTQRTTPYADRQQKSENVKPVVIDPRTPVLINLFVEDQNTAIGKRNIHSLKSGFSLSVGGGKSDDFLIFLVPLPANLGELRRDGSNFTFIPKKPKYFPDLGSSELKDCLNKTIRIISDKNYELKIRFIIYEDPLLSINRVLMSVKLSG